MSRRTLPVAPHAGGELLTDSNGREMLRRRRGARASWPPPPFEPAAANYYPITSAVLLEGGGMTLGVATERAQGAASLADGVLEVMLHRCAHEPACRAASLHMWGCRACRKHGTSCPQPQHRGASHDM